MQAQRQEPGIVIRSVGPFDLGRLARLHRTCFTEGWRRSDLANLLALPGSFALIARQVPTRFPGFDAIRGAGFSICRIAKDECELLSLGVVPEARRKGIGTALLAESMARCRQSGAATMFLEVAVDNQEARSLYLDHGFETVGTRPNYYRRNDGSRAHAYTMKTTIPSALPSAIGA